MDPDFMENGKLERMQKAADQWVQQHPEEVWRIQELARRAAEKYYSEEFQAFWQPAKAAMEGGDKAGIVVWAEDRTGHKPHSRVRVHLTGEELEESTPAETFELVDVWGARSEGRGKVHDLEQRLPQIRGGIKKFASVEQALATLALEGQSREHALQDNLLGMAYELEAPALSDAKLGGKIASQIRREVCERTPTRSEELQQLAEFVDHEAFVKQELERGRKAGLPPRELEVHKLCVENPGIKNREVAAKLGISVGTVGALKSRIKKTLNTA